jgi:hypothetical protein
MRIYHRINSPHSDKFFAVVGINMRCVWFGNKRVGRDYANAVIGFYVAVISAPYLSHNRNYHQCNCDHRARLVEHFAKIYRAVDFALNPCSQLFHTPL